VSVRTSPKSPIAAPAALARAWLAAIAVSGAAHAEPRTPTLREAIGLAERAAPAAVDARHVRVIANLNKRRWLDRRRLRGLLSEAHFLLFPSRAECFGMVCAEANAFGVPVIASDVGGIPVDDGQNGRRVDLRRGAAGFADPIEALWRYPAAYAALRASAREVYDRRLNWDVWGQAVATELRRLAQAPRQEEAR